MPRAVIRVCLLSFLWLGSGYSVRGAQESAAEVPFPPDLVSFQQVRPKPVFAGRGEGFWDARIRERGWILREGDRYRMWYTGYDGTREGIRRVGYADSTDGIQWNRRDQPLVDDLWIEDMCVLRHEGRYLMFAEGRNDQAQLLVSPDGLRWSREGRLDVRLRSGEPIPPGPYGTPTVLVDGDMYYLFYERRDAGVWLARSKDLRRWTNVSDDPVLSPGPEKYDGLMIALNQVIKRGEWYYALYHGSGSPEKPRLWCTGIAASRDLRTWKKFPRNPLQPVAQNKSSGIIVPSANGLRFYTMHDRVFLHESPAEAGEAAP